MIALPIMAEMNQSPHDQNANNEFALKMYKNILEKNPDKNIFFSPTSIMIAMAMAYEGADGNTAQEMSNALHILPDDNTRRENIASAIKSINKQDVKYMVTNVVNSLWIKDGFSVHDEYADVLNTYYNSILKGLSALNFVDDCIPALKLQTNHMLPQLLLSPLHLHLQM